MNQLRGLSPRVLLCILDGFGETKTDLKNAILHARKPTLDEIFAHYPHMTIQPGGEAVGLPKGVAGNSEVGHMNLGAGRPVRQDLVRISEAIQNNSFTSLPKWDELLKTTIAGSKRLHLVGLLSDGRVHSDIAHLKYILDRLRPKTEIQVFLHLFMDGRDTNKEKGIGYLEDILAHGGFELASIQGRSIGMDRDRRWEKIKHCIDVMTGTTGETKLDPVAYMKEQYANGIFDEFITPAYFSKSATIRSGDAVFFFNFRPDRARQLTLAFNDPSFNEFPVSVRPGYWLCMTPYVQDELPQLPILFDKEKIPGTLAAYLAKLGKKQFKIAETEKYAHVTYFFNGGEQAPFPGEERLLINSPREVATYDQKPQMSAPQVTQALLEKLSDTSISLFVVNFANADMVGHTGKYEAAMKAIESLDGCVAQLMKKCAQENITILLTADHGNADQMIYPDGSVHTAHSESEVPFCVIHPSLRDQQLTINPAVKVAALKDVAPTVLEVLAIPQPPDFTGQPLFL